MLKLQHLARKSFDEFNKRNNISANWSCLSNERKLVWMKEILDLNRLILDSIITNIKDIPPYKPGMSGLEAGVSEGRRKERMLLKQQLDDYYSNLLEEYNNFSHNSRKKK